MASARDMLLRRSASLARRSPYGKWVPGNLGAKIWKVWEVYVEVDADALLF
jgi:hypothetical protein